MAAACGLSGSSPRVRGLLVLALTALTVMGIIPARAGFTFKLPLYNGSDQDHPRACGVYNSASRGADSEGGSSPRVRGLLNASAVKDKLSGIIPARAGFTIGQVVASGSGTGSSPRVRGLQPWR